MLKLMNEYLESRYICIFWNKFSHSRYHGEIKPQKPRNWQFFLKFETFMGVKVNASAFKTNCLSWMTKKKKSMFFENKFQSFIIIP